MLATIERQEAEYNARDTLGMCRVFPLLLEEIEQHDVVQVYEIDRQMADLALQMTRAGMPVNQERRQEIGNRLRTMRDTARVMLMDLLSDPEIKTSFVSWAAAYLAATVRKGEPVAGTVQLGPTRAFALLQAARENLAAGRALPPSGDTTADAARLKILLSAVMLARAEWKVAQLVSADEYAGLPYDDDSAFQARATIRAKEFEAKIEKHGINLAAKVQQAALLRAVNVPLTQMTKSGLPKINREILEQYGRHAVATALLTYQLTEKTINMYIEGETRLAKAQKGGGTGRGRGSRPFVVEADSFSHPLWDIHKITGRWGSSPNVQNFSKRAGGGAENLRAMVEAPPGYTFVGADQKQLEARLVGAMSQCKMLLETFKSGGDVHSVCASIWREPIWSSVNAVYQEHKKALGKCHCDKCVMRDKIRDITKRFEYGGFYGGAAQALWEANVKDFPDLTMGDAYHFLAEVGKRMPEVLAWREYERIEALRTGEIRSPILGRRQVFPLHQLGRVEPTVVYNYKAQAGAADLWDLGAVEFCKLWDQAGTDVRLLHNGHDSVLVLAREDLAPRVEQDVYACWNRTWNGVPFEMECKIAYTWSET
jgi:DNA polymerase I-like protein with 3'-5' exonuclease and polymerase domains